MDQKLDKNGQRRGGARVGAGRKPIGPYAGSDHKARGELDPHCPQRITLRVVTGVSGIRRPDAYRAICVALDRVLANHVEFRIVHISVQSTHVHLLCEADNRDALARGVQGFEISAAKQLNAVISKRHGKARRGQVFNDRYLVESISTVQQTRNALVYVINNWRQHLDDTRGDGLFGGRIDRYSSGVRFEGWRDELGGVALPADYQPMPVSRPQTWLLAEGWKRATPISMFEVPEPPKPREC